MFSPARLLPREKRRSSPSDRRDNRADHTCRADTASLQQDHEKSSWRKEFAEVFAAGRPSGCSSGRAEYAGGRPDAVSHSAMRISSAVVAPKLAISRALPSWVGAHTQCRSLPRSIPATFRRIAGKPWSCLRLPSELSISCFPVISLPHPSEHARPGWPVCGF
jgi:hypothetical protein